MTAPQAPGPQRAWHLVPAGKARKFILLFLLLVAAPGMFFLVRSGTHRFMKLPYYGPKEVEAPGDTLYHTIPPFAFMGSDGQVVSDTSLAGNIIVADFFFTRCTTICPKMNGQMQQLQLRMGRDGVFKDVVLLSHTVDPEHDTPEVLAEHARHMQADPARWKFVTGTKEDLYLQGSEGYLLAAREDVMAPDGFLHSEHFVLVDKQRHIRGIYDGTKSAEVDRLFTDIKNLVREENEKARLAREAQQR